MAAKDEVKELFSKKFGPASVSMLDSIVAGNDASYTIEAYHMLSRKVGATVARSFMENILSKYNVKGD